MYQVCEAVCLQNLLYSFCFLVLWLINAMLGFFSTDTSEIILQNSFHLHLRERIVHFSK